MAWAEVRPCFLPFIFSLLSFLSPYPLASVMFYPPLARSTTQRPRKRRKRRSDIWRWLPNARVRRRWLQAFRKLTPTTQVCVLLVVVFVAWLGVNGIVQVLRKPSELFYPVSGVLFKTPAETWDKYEVIFERHATATITPDFLAALAQTEASGNPVARTYWRWSLTMEPFEVYRPASSAVGMYQITDGTFAEARRHCIHDHVVVEDGPWNDFRSCWFNWAYSRVVPSHATEMTSAYLDRRVAGILARQRIANATLQQKQALAAVIHLCGAGVGETFARRKFRPAKGLKCGDHNVAAYLSRVGQMKSLFRGLAQEKG